MSRGIRDQTQAPTHPSHKAWRRGGLAILSMGDKGTKAKPSKHPLHRAWRLGGLDIMVRGIRDQTQAPKHPLHKALRLGGFARVLRGGKGGNPCP